MREGLIYLPLVPGEEAGGRLRAEAWGVERIRWTLWNGSPCVYPTDCAITSFRIELEMHRRGAHSAGRAVERIDCMLERLEEFRRYLYANGESLVNYIQARIAGERVSAPHVESTVNQLVNWRMCKRWSAAGAQLVLHVGGSGTTSAEQRQTTPPQSRSPLDRPRFWRSDTVVCPNDYGNCRMDPAKVAQMVEVLNGLAARDALR